MPRLSQRGIFNLLTCIVMVIFKKIHDLQHYLQGHTKPISFIPTMGALHAGHLSLVAAAKEKASLTVCSIFINPTQFNDPNDYQLYPVTTAEDIKLLLGADCDILFLPDAGEIYPYGTEMATAYNFGELENVLEGAHRPGHFRGVGQVVGRLLEIVKPDHLYMGQKDYQQCKVIGKLIGLMGLEGKTILHINPTVREADGLAMSSRNRRLTEPQRALAGTIYQCLVSIQGKAGTAPFSVVKKECNDILTSKGFEPEYIALADADTLAEAEDYTQDKNQVALIAAKIGGVRLIDNMLMN